MIVDPHNPPRLFDGLARVYSTCRACGELLQIVHAQDPVHPCCTPEPLYIETLATGWLSCVLAGDVEAERYTAQALREAARQPPDLVAAAIRYAENGWPVFPLAKRSKAPAIPKDKGGKGFKQATNDPVRIQRWWTKHPDHNIGLATGHAFDVIDVDTKDKKGNPSTAGIISFAKALADNKIPDTHAVVCTASGGIHLYVKPTGKGNFAGLRPGIDYRGLGGYVVAPPSIVGGRTYMWTTEPSPIIKRDK